MGILQARKLEWVAMPSSKGSSQLRDRTQGSCISGRFFLPSEPPGEPTNTGVGSLSLLQGIFSTQESNQRLLHCRWILYQLSFLREAPLRSYWRILNKGMYFRRIPRAAVSGTDRNRLPGRLPVPIQVHYPNMLRMSLCVPSTSLQKHLGASTS